VQNDILAKQEEQQDEPETEQKGIVVERRELPAEA